MIKSGVFISVTALVLAACSPVVVPKERGVGFDDAANRALREAQLSASVGSIVPPPQVNSIPSQAPFQRSSGSSAIAGAELAAAGIGQSAQPDLPANLGADPLRTQGLDASPSNPAPELANSTGLSDEQNFDVARNKG